MLQFFPSTSRAGELKNTVIIIFKVYFMREITFSRKYRLVPTGSPWVPEDDYETENPQDGETWVIFLPLASL